MLVPSTYYDKTRRELDGNDAGSTAQDLWDKLLSDLQLNSRLQVFSTGLISVAASGTHIGMSFNIAAGKTLKVWDYGFSTREAAITPVELKNATDAALLLTLAAGTLTQSTLPTPLLTFAPTAQKTVQLSAVNSDAGAAKLYNAFIKFSIE